MIKAKENRLTTIGIYSFYTIIVFDFITKTILTYPTDGFDRYSLIPKLIINTVLLILVAKTFRFAKTKYVVFYFGMFSFAFIAFILLYNHYDPIIISKQLYNLLLYSYPFILVTYLNIIDVEKKRELVLALEKPIIYVGIISSILIFLGLFTKIELFRSYRYSNRFGFNGVFLKTSEASYYFIFLLCLSGYQFLKEKKSIFLLVLFLVSSLLLGTKIVWLFLALVMAVFFWNRYKKTTIGIMLASIVLYVLYRKPIDLLFITHLPNGKYLYKENGIISIFTSTRDVLLEKTLKFSEENWSIFNCFFGGNKYWIYKVEFEFFDLFFLFGIAGIVLFYFFVKNTFYKKIKNTYAKYMLIMVFICAFFAGNFFKSFLVFSVFCICFELINLKTGKV